jgi:hypothetical protein
MTTRRSVLRTLAGLPLVAGATNTLLASMLNGGNDLTASMWIYLWDIVDEGYDPVMARLKENRLTSVSLATAYHAGKFLAPHNPKRKVVFLEDGTVYFRPDPKRYKRITPLVNSLVKAGHDLKSVKAHADKAGLETRSWVVCCHNSPLGRAYPDTVTRTAFGDPLYHNLCPSNEDVRAYLRALVKDVAGHGVTTIELEALQFQPYTHGEHHEREGIALGSIPRFLLGLCFCDACRKAAARAKVDIDAVHTFTRGTLGEYFQHPEKVEEQYPRLLSLPADVFEKFLDWRCMVITSLLEELSAQAGDVLIRPIVNYDPEWRMMVGVDVRVMAAITGGVLMPGYVKDAAALRPVLSRLQAALAERSITVGMQVGMPESGGKAEFNDRMNLARERGITSFNFYNYGFIPLERLGWIRDALS